MHHSRHDPNNNITHKRKKTVTPVHNAHGQLTTTTTALFFFEHTPLHLTHPPPQKKEPFA